MVLLLLVGLCLARTGVGLQLCRGLLHRFGLAVEGDATGYFRGMDVFFGHTSFFGTRCFYTLSVRVFPGMVENGACLVFDLVESRHFGSLFCLVSILPVLHR